MFGKARKAGRWGAAGGRSSRRVGSRGVGGPGYEQAVMRVSAWTRRSIPLQQIPASLGLHDLMMKSCERR